MDFLATQITGSYLLNPTGKSRHSADSSILYWQQRGCQSLTGSRGQHQPLQPGELYHSDLILRTHLMMVTAMAYNYVECHMTCLPIHLLNCCLSSAFHITSVDRQAIQQSTWQQMEVTLRWSIFWSRQRQILNFKTRYSNYES